MSPGELQGKYAVALEQIGSKAGSERSERRKPIYQRTSQISEQQAIEDAAAALTALWKIRRSHKS